MKKYTEDNQAKILIDTLPTASITVIDRYFYIKATENRFVRCPYFRNPKSGHERWGLAVYGGKGSPAEIEEELKIIEKLEGADFSKMPDDKIRDIMKKRKLGVDCSGFIVQVLDVYSRKIHKKALYKMINFNRRGFGWLFCKMRPYTHIDVETLVHARNAREVLAVNEVAPGDLLRFNSEIDHAIIITATEKDRYGILKKIHYAHSVLEENREGVKKGVIELIHSADEDLQKQNWSEEPQTGHTIIEKGVPRIYRLNIISRG